MPESLQQRYLRLQERIAAAMDRSGRLPDTLCLIGVSKKQSWQSIQAALDLGLHHFGENYCQEWQTKAEKLLQRKNEIFWHFIGHLQSNKVKDVVGQVEYIHTIDSLKLAEKVSKRSEALGLKQKVLLEINLAAEASKAGFLIEDVVPNLADLSHLPGLAIQGLMGIPPVGPNAEASRVHFKKLKSLLDEWNRSGIFTPPLTELSMGMSQDFEVAIEEGATMIRVGTELFGPRN